MFFCVCNQFLIYFTSIIVYVNHEEQQYQLIRFRYFVRDHV